jgi:hypothetical protein
MIAPFCPPAIHSMDFDVFISYAHDDKPVADAACAIFEQAGVRCFIAPRDIRSGAIYAAELDAALNACKALVLFFSGRANESPHIRREVEIVVSRGVDLIPVRIENIEPTAALGYYMRSVHWLDAITPPIEQHLHKLANELSEKFGPKAARISPPPVQASIRSPQPAVTPPVAPATVKASADHLLRARIAGICGLVCGGINILMLVALHDTVDLLLAVVGAVVFYVLVFRNLTRDLTMARTMNIVGTALLGIYWVSVMTIGNLFFMTTEGINLIFSTWLIYEINQLIAAKAGPAPVQL